MVANPESGGYERRLNFWKNESADAFLNRAACNGGRLYFLQLPFNKGNVMKSRNLLLPLIGGWIMFIAIDATNGKVGKLGVRSLGKPVQFAWFVTKTIRSFVLFCIAVVTFLVVVQGSKKEKVSQN